MRSILQMAIFAAALALSGCGQSAAPPKAAAPDETAPLPELSKPARGPAALQPAGKSETMAPDGEDGTQEAASVVELTYLQNQGDLTVKVFGTAGGDPAMNGLYTYVAFYVSTADGWRVFKLGDFLEYKVLSEAPGRIDLELKESVMNDASGEIASRDRRVIVNWPVAADAAPENISVTPAK